MLFDALHVIPGKAVDVEVDEQHNKTWNEEGDERRNDGITGIEVQSAGVGVFRWLKFRAKVEMFCLKDWSNIEFLRSLCTTSLSTLVKFIKYRYVNYLI